MPAISFCTWVRDWPQIKQTMPINLVLTAGHDVEFVVVDLGSRDDTVEWLRALADPRLRVEEAVLESLHFARAYNLAHQRGTGEILVNLDADNVVGPRYVERLLQAVAEEPRVIYHAWTGDWSDGTCGRLAYRRELFELGGGFDEALAPVGYQDLDLRDRLQALGGVVRVCTDPTVVGLAIRTHDGRKMQHIDGDYVLHNQMNAATSRDNIAAGRLVVNRR